MMEMSVNLDLVKSEGVSTVCNSCLSQDRLLTALEDHADLFMYLLGDQGSSISPDRVYVCWECTAVLKKMSKFQWQAQCTQIALQKMLLGENQLPQSFSNLSKIKFENLNITNFCENVSTNNIYNHYEEKVFDNQHETDIPEVTVIENTLTFNDKVILKTIKEDNSDLEPNISDHEEFDSINESKHIKSEEEIKPVKSKQRKVKKYMKFDRIAKITKNPDVDLNNYKILFYESTLLESDIDKKGTYKANKRTLKNNFSCVECQKQFDTILDLKRHTTFLHILKENLPGPFTCLECSTSCPDASALRSHWTRHNSALRCKLCAAVVWWKNNMRNHAKRHENQFHCKLCTDMKVVCHSYRHFRYHHRAIHQRSLCDYCGQPSKTKAALLKHIRLKHLPSICTICNKQFKNNMRLQRHNSEEHPHLLNKAVKPECTYCVECNKQFPSEAKYKKHLVSTVAHNPRVAARKKIVPCPECDKVFSRKSYMNNHYRLFHQKQTKHYCELCDKYLVSAWSMKKHIQGVHQKIREPKTKVCDLCGRAFTTNAILTKHRRTHTGERPYRCAHCPAAFAQSSALTSHMRSQHKHTRS